MTAYLDHKYVDVEEDTKIKFCMFEGSEPSESEWIESDTWIDAKFAY